MTTPRNAERRTMTPEQRDLARHALGLPNGRNRSYRNRFVTGPECEDHAPWIAMVKSYLARGVKNRRIYGGMDYFWLTPAGAALALDPGETLCQEDFPEGRT